MNLEEARILADKVVRMRDPSLATQAITESLAESVLELADEVERLNHFLTDIELQLLIDSPQTALKFAKEGLGTLKEEDM